MGTGVGSASSSRRRDRCSASSERRSARSEPGELSHKPVFLTRCHEKGVRATATAQVVYGTSANCMLPFAGPDRWLEQREDEGTDPPGGVPDTVDDFAIYPDDEPDDVPWDPDTDTYDAFETQGQQGGNPLNGVVDVYLPGSRTFGGTGHDARLDHGMRVMLKAGNGSQIAPSWYYPIVLPDGQGGGASNYRDRIQNCDRATFAEEG